jgi:Na+/proline symporter
VGVPALDWASIVIYLLVLVAIAIFFSRFMSGAKDFFAGGRQIPWWVAGISMYMGLFSAWTFSGGASLVYRTGWYGVMYFATWPVGFFIGFMLGGVRCRRSRVISPVEYVETRFNRATHVTLSVLYAVSLLYWPIQHMASLGKMVGPTLFAAISPELAVAGTIVVIALLILFYTFSGGLWAVSVSDAVQSFLVIGIVGVLVVVAFTELPGIIGRLPAFDMTPDNEPMYGPWFLLAYILQGVFAAAMGDRAQRYYSVRDERAVFKLGLLATALFMTGPLLFGFIPLVGRVLWPDPAMIPGFGGIANPQEGVFIAVAARFLPPGILGMFIAAMLAATMSATDTCWNTASAIVSVDLYKGVFRRRATDRQVMMVGRIAIVVFFCVAVAGALAITLKGVKLDIVGFTVGLLTGVAVTIPLMLGLVVRRVSRWAGVGAVVMGTLAALVASDLSIFGGLEVVGFLKLPFGSRVFFIIGVTLAAFLLSRPMGRIGRRRLAAGVLGSLVALLMWPFFLFCNANDSVSWGLLTGSAPALPGGGSLVGYLVAMTIAALAFGGLTYLFCRIYSRGLGEPEPDVDRFFVLLKTPIDAQREVGEARQTATAYPFVGMIVLGLAVMSLALLLFPGGRARPAVNIALAVMLGLVGTGIMRGGRELLRKIEAARRDAEGDPLRKIEAPRDNPGEGL